MNISDRRIVSVVLAGLVAVGTVGCGNKGPLVLPERPASQEQTDSPEAAAAEDPAEAGPGSDDVADDA